MDGTTILLFVAGGAALTVGADLLVRGASAVAKRLGVSALVVGLTVVSFGTSAPEAAVSVAAAFKGSADVAFGNVVGSNIFNVLVVLALSAIAAPLIVGARLLRQDVPAMIGSALLASLLAADGVVGRLDGCLLLGLAVAYTIHLVQEGRREGAGPDDGNGGKKKLPGIVLALFVLSGLALLVLGSDWFVEAAVRTAKAFGVSDLVVGLTIVAAGTSLPELAASVAASIKGERDIAVGNVVGSNIFNIFLVLGAAAVVAPNGVPVSEEAIRVHLPIMTGVCVACLPIFITGSKVDRVEGLLLFGGYLSYAAHLVLTATNHPSAAAFATAMSSVVVPIVAAYLIVSAWRRKSRAG